MLQYRAIFICK